MSARAKDGGLGPAARLRRDLSANLAFFTRLPLHGAEAGPPDFGRIAWAAPLAGALVGAVGGLALMLGQGLSLPPMLSAGFAVLALVLTTGALHEDGLADLADGFGGGGTREAKLAILRDSRIGTYGAIAIGLSLILRVVAIAAMLRQGASPGPGLPPGPPPGLGLGFGFGALVLAGAAARVGALAPLALLPPARKDGAGASVGRLGEAPMRAAIYALAAVAVVVGGLWLGVMRALFALVLAGAAAYGLAALARRQIGGQTGDVAGASAQVVEIAVLCALLIGGRGA